MSRARAYLTIACAAALVGGFLAARALLAPPAPSSSRVPTARRFGGATTAARPSAAISQPRSVARPGPGPWRTDEGIPVGFAHSERGAVAAAGSYLTVLSKTVSPAARWSWTQAIDTLTVLPLRATALRASGANQAVRLKLALATSAFVGSWLLGYRVLAYSSERARVKVWNMGLVASASSLVGPYYSTATCALVWARGDWKIAGAQTTPGPTPPSTAGQTQTAAFVTAAGRFTPYRNVP